METITRRKPEINLTGISSEVAGLIPDLIMNKDYHKKVIAKDSLIYMGESVLPQLYIMLNSNYYELRLTAARILQKIHSEDSINTFIRLLSDNYSSLRWIAARGLILIGRSSIVPLLKSIISGKKSLYHKWGAHYVLVNLLTDEEKHEFRSLLKSISNTNYTSISAPFEAIKSLKIFRCMNFNA
jgi:hypothetical protein